MAAVNAAGATPTATNTPTNTATSTSTATSTPTPAAAVITGTVTYGNAIGAPTPRFVSNVLISGAGSPPVSTSTITSGTYTLSGFGAGAYTITPSKSGGQNGSISSFDAAKISQHVVGATTLNATQLIVADVSGAGGVSSFDSALVASYAVSAPNTGQTGTWRFSPVNVSHPSISSSIAGEDYIALLMGDVSGNWVDTGARPSIASGPEKPVRLTIPAVSTSTGTINVPVSVKGIAGKGIISYEFDLRYDPSVIMPMKDAIELGQTVSRGCSIAVNAQEPGLVRVAVYGASAIEENGILLNLRFSSVGKPGSDSQLKWERIVLNEGSPAVTTSDGSVNILAANSSTTDQNTNSIF